MEELVGKPTLGNHDLTYVLGNEYNYSLLGE